MKLKLVEITMATALNVNDTAWDFAGQRYFAFQPLATRAQGTGRYTDGIYL